MNIFFSLWMAQRQKYKKNKLKQHPREEFSCEDEKRVFKGGLNLYHGNHPLRKQRAQFLIKHWSVFSGHTPNDTGKIKRESFVSRRLIRHRDELSERRGAKNTRWEWEEGGGVRSYFDSAVLIPPWTRVKTGATLQKEEPL